MRTFPTPEPEADGTLEWSATTAVVVLLEAGDHIGLGLTYSSPAAEAVIQHHLADIVRGSDALAVAADWEAMHRAGRNLGTRGLFAHALSAVDIARWDLAARVLGTNVAALAGGAIRGSIPFYGSGGFTTLDDTQLADQVDSWLRDGATRVKIKIGESWGTRIDRDLSRVHRLAALVGPGVAMMVDANGGYSPGQARRVGLALDDLGVDWFEEPVSSDAVSSLNLVRLSVRCDVTAGEYAADLYDIAALLPVVDCLQLDATRCGGYTGFLRGAALAASSGLQVSAHCAPAVHAPIATAVPNLRHVEYFVDHARLEPQLMDGVATAADGVLTPSAGNGHGLTLRRPAATP
ncbi:enolase C-terminal domain-like protein [Lapillicoccus jejuensis]|uniref:enolase C-terminal domain-like protein n=1 Tax=Lapillicoccus jejuensis TaxID=402171 RepID=UPI001B85FDA1|nr:enolase C-terminal domain-like protein [Lapillicoccus jejuensis]